MIRGAENMQKHPLQTFLHIFCGGQLLGLGFYYNIYPFWGFWELIYTYKHTTCTIWVCEGFHDLQTAVASIL